MMMTSRRFPSLKRRELDLWESSPKRLKDKSCKPWSYAVNKIEDPSWNHCSVITGNASIFPYNQFTVLYIYIYNYICVIYVYIYVCLNIYIYIYIYISIYLHILQYIYIYMCVLFKINICAWCGWMENLHLGQESPDGQAHMEQFGTSTNRML